MTFSDSGQGSFSRDGSGSGSERSSRNTEDEIAGGKRAKSKKTLKRKRRATEPSVFGAALHTLLNTDTPTTLPLSLKPSIAKERNDERLEERAKKVVRIERKEKEDKGRITDVIGGWGAESERVLRKVAQRGVVKLFNTIQQSHSTVSNESKRRRAKKDGLKEATVNHDDFFDMIRSGVVSTA